jgi:hypothetical protein
MNSQNNTTPGVLESRPTGNSVSRLFPALETPFSAYLCGITASVSVFPVFPTFSAGVSR